MKFRRLLCVLFSAAIMLTSVLCSGMAASAASTGLSVTSSYKSGIWTVQLYGMTKKQYTALVNNDYEGFRVNVFSEDGLSSIFLATDLTNKTDTPDIPGCKLGYPIYGGVYGRGLTSYSTWASTITCDGLYGTAPGKSYGFVWTFDNSDEQLHDFLPSMFCSDKVKITFENVLGDAINVSGIGKEASVSAVWAEAPLEYRVDGSCAYVTIPAVSMNRYTGNAKAKLELSLTAGKYTINTSFSGGEKSFTYNASSSGTDITGSVAIGGKFDKYGAAELSFDIKEAGAEKVLSSRKASVTFSITENGKLVCGSKAAVTLTAPEPPKDISALKISKIPSVIYTGKAVTPEITIKDGKYKLVNEKDFIISCRSNVLVGTATVTITGRNNYTGSITKTFKVIPGTPELSAVLSGTKAKLSWSSVKGADKYQIYKSENGGEFKLAATVKGNLSSRTIKNISSAGCQFKIRAITKSDGKYIPGGWSEIISV